MTEVERNHSEEEGEAVPEQNGNTWVSYKDLLASQTSQRTWSGIFNVTTLVLFLGIMWTVVESHKDAGHHDYLMWPRYNDARKADQHRIQALEERNKRLEDRIENLEKRHQEQAADPNIMKEIRRLAPHDIRELAKER